MSKTIPMWCAVMNRAIHRLRQQAAGAAAAPSAAAGAGEAAPCGALAAEQAAAGAAPGAVHWDCGLHLPPWVSDVERNSIQQRLDGWVDDLFGVSASSVPSGRPAGAWQAGPNAGRWARSA